jgi:excisionase family DNA binding protein
MMAAEVVEMTRVLEERTILPPSLQLGALDALARVLVRGAEPRGAKLIGPDNEVIELPEEVYHAMREVVEAMSQGLAITIAPHNTMLTTQEAADLLNISRPTLVRLLEDGEIPYSMRGRHRRVLLKDVLAYREHSRSERRAGLDEMVSEAEEAGLYDSIEPMKPTRLGRIPCVNRRCLTRASFIPPIFATHCSRWLKTMCTGRCGRNTFLPSCNGTSPVGLVKQPLAAASNRCGGSSGMPRSRVTRI